MDNTNGPPSFSSSFFLSLCCLLPITSHNIITTYYDSKTSCVFSLVSPLGFLHAPTFLTLVSQYFSLQFPNVLFSPPPHFLFSRSLTPLFSNFTALVFHLNHLTIFCFAKVTLSPKEGFTGSDSFRTS